MHRKKNLNKHATRVEFYKVRNVWKQIYWQDFLDLIYNLLPTWSVNFYQLSRKKILQNLIFRMSRPSCKKCSFNFLILFNFAMHHFCKLPVVFYFWKKYFSVNLNAWFTNLAFLFCQLLLLKKKIKKIKKKTTIIII